MNFHFALQEGLENKGRALSENHILNPHLECDLGYIG